MLVINDSKMLRLLINNSDSGVDREYTTEYAMHICGDDVGSTYRRINQCKDDLGRTITLSVVSRRSSSRGNSEPVREILAS